MKTTPGWLSATMYVLLAFAMVGCGPVDESSEASDMGNEKLAQLIQGYTGGTYWYIMNPSTGDCLYVDKERAHEGGYPSIRLWPCKNHVPAFGLGGNDNRFRFRMLDSGSETRIQGLVGEYYYGQCITNYPSTNPDTARVLTIRDCRYVDGHGWWHGVDKNNNNSFWYLMNRTGAVVTPHNYSTADYNWVHEWPAEGKSSQNWVFYPW